MSSSSQLTGSELIDCTRASMKRGIEAAARNSGYGDDLKSFENELRKACQSMGINVKDFADLVSIEQTATE
ncbi:MAG: hypothetical protein AAF378_18420 [Cyanobacteria bacterium P01_A01_bin.84]